MTRFIDIITHSSKEIQLLLFMLTLLLAGVVESFAADAGLFKRWRHASLNLPFILTNFLPQALLGIAFIHTIAWTGAHRFGILYALPLMKHPLLLFLCSFILLDFGEYVYHVIMHRVKRLWMFHAVHHSDPVVDISTTLREHPGETFIRLSFTLLWVFLTGSLLWVFLLRQTVQVFTTVFAHMNYQLPAKANNWLGMLFITPNLHRVHHHFQRPFTDRNYGDVLSIWDRLFGTFEKWPDAPLTFGVDTYMERDEHSRFLSLVTLPFLKYRKRDNEPLKSPAKM